MLTRRRYLQLAAAVCAVAGGRSARVLAQSDARSGTITRHAIPSTGEEIPIIGLGSSASFQRLADSGESEAIRAVMEALLDGGGTVFDTAPSYGSAEAVAGRLVGEMNARDRVFWATKLNVAGFGGGSADAQAAWRQVETSLDRYGAEPVDLIQVHNIADMATQFSILRELKDAGRARYIGMTSTFKPQYEAFEQYLRTEPLDFIGIDYAVDNTSAEERLFPICQDRGIAVMVYMPFGRSRLWERVDGHEVPDWAQAFGAATWAQFFLKFAASHPAVTVVTPATSRPHHMVDNLGAAYGRLPNAEERQRMIDFIDSLPEA